MITLDDMRDKLLTETDLKKMLGEHEPINTVTVQPGVSKMRLKPGWVDGHNVDDDLDVDAAVITTANGDEYYFSTAEAVTDVTSLLGIPGAYVRKTPGDLMTPHLNFWMQQLAEKGIKLLVSDRKILGATKDSITPFSNLALLDLVTETVRNRWGSTQEILADYKSQHDLGSTRLRLIFPTAEDHLVSADDGWSVGINLANSLLGDMATSVSGYLFRWTCTNGMITTRNGSGNWSRKAGQGPEVMDWARLAIDNILGGFEHEFAMLDEAKHTPIGDSMQDYIGEVFSEFRVPLAARAQIIENLVDSDDLTVYGAAQAITAAANEAPAHIADRLMSIGNNLSHAHTCEACHRPLVN